MAKLVVGVNDLQSKFPKIAEEWDYELNFPLTPDKITYGSEKKVFWKCSKYPDHKWEASVNSRTNMNCGCPICAGKQVLKGFNDLETLNPSLAKEWHPTKNGDLKPNMVTCFNHKKIWWKCEKGHEWKASIYSRMKSGCPYCSGRKAIRGKTDLLTLYPKLCAEEWDYEKNGKLTPDLIKPQSHIKVWWRCKNNHSWKATPHHRINGTGCPICAGKQVLKGFNDLETLNPSLAKEWHPTKNGDLKPSDVTLFSHKKVWWRCSKNENHEWQAVVSSRNRGRACPICAKERMVSFPEKNNCILFEKGFTYSGKYIY